jgi:hypothetical protein
MNMAFRQKAKRDVAQSDERMAAALFRGNMVDSWTSYLGFRTKEGLGNLCILT